MWIVDAVVDTRARLRQRGKKLPVVLTDDGGVLDDTMLCAGLKSQPGGQTRVAAIPNIELLCQLLDVRLPSPAH